VDGRVVFSDVGCAPRHNILSPALQLSISQKALEKFPEDGNVMPKLLGATVHN
jgi:hypothetical protein